MSTHAVFDCLFWGEQTRACSPHDQLRSQCIIQRVLENPPLGQNLAEKQSITVSKSRSSLAVELCIPLLNYYRLAVPPLWALSGLAKCVYCVWPCPCSDRVAAAIHINCGFAINAPPFDAVACCTARAGGAGRLILQLPTAINPFRIAIGAKTRNALCIIKNQLEYSL